MSQPSVTIDPTRKQTAPAFIEHHSPEMAISDSTFPSPPRASPKPKLPTGDLDPRIKVKKRIIVCCDGFVFYVRTIQYNLPYYLSTWQDGLTTNIAWKFTNVLVRCLCERAQLLLIKIKSAWPEPLLMRTPERVSLAFATPLHYITRRIV
jgi:hypothetical protein